mmetsp:Transcript_69013/g.192872  ORF Transcript_69013/g.192872 Transcript_69013/m.192872 type:complete len:235 (+) Transcript_69013:316-1020(+)
MVAGLRAREGLLRVLGRASAQFHEGFALARLGGFLGHGGVQPLFRSRVGGVFSIPRGGSDGRWCVRGAQTGGTECTDTPQTAHAPQSARVPHPGCSSLRLTCLRGPSDSRVLVSSASSSAEGSDSSPLELAAAMSLRRASQCSTITRASEGSSVQKVEVKVWSLIKSNHVRHPLTDGWRMKLVGKVCWCMRLVGEVGGTGGRVAGALVAPVEEILPPLMLVIQHVWGRILQVGS